MLGRMDNAYHSQLLARARQNALACSVICPCAIFFQSETYTRIKGLVAYTGISAGPSGIRDRLGVADIRVVSIAGAVHFRKITLFVAKYRRQMPGRFKPNPHPHRI